MTMDKIYHLTTSATRLLIGLSALLLLLGLSSPAHALPSFARQTGMVCTACHTQAFGPNLTPMGRQFKLGGYTSGGNDSFLSRFGGMAIGSLTHTQKNDPALKDPANIDFARRGYNSNNNLALDQASLFYGGKVVGPMGAFVQFTYDGVYNKFALDNTDIRLSHETELFDKSLVYGVSFNNNPSSQDLWNTAPAWSFPYASSPLAAAPGAGPIIGAVSQQVGGATLYGMFNDLLYLEAGAYSSFAKYAQKGMGQWDSTFSPTSGAYKLDGGAPYWRIALQKEWQGHYFSLGHFGFRAAIQPDSTMPATDRYTDLGMDFNYQYLANPLHIYEFKASYIREQQQLAASYDPNNPPPASPNYNQQLGFVALNGSYTYDQTYSFTTGYNYINGSSDASLYGSSPTLKPNSEYFTFELNYVPFGKTAGDNLATYMNLRLALQYIAYTRFDGGHNNYDSNGVPGGRNAADNNTLYFNTWLNF